MCYGRRTKGRQARVASGRKETTAAGVDEARCLVFLCDLLSVRMTLAMEHHHGGQRELRTGLRICIWF